MSLYKVSKEQGNSETSEGRLVKVELRIRCTQALLGEEIKELPPASLGEEYSQVEQRRQNTVHQESEQRHPEQELSRHRDGSHTG